MVEQASVTLDSIQVFDYLNIAQDPTLLQLVKTTPTEKLLFSDKIKKTNMYEWTQERTLVITSENIYNIHKKSVKRSINILDVNGISKTIPPSKCTTEFTIHVERSYDYRFISSRRDQIVDQLKRLYIVKKGKNCPLFGIVEKDLKDFTTTEKDFKKGTNRRPLESMLINEDLVKCGAAQPSLAHAKSQGHDKEEELSYNEA